MNHAQNSRIKANLVIQMQLQNLDINHIIVPVF